MSEPQPSKQESDKWHRRFGVEANNRAWALCEQATLGPAQRREALYAAYAAAYHWSKIGTAEHFARAELLLGRVHALLGQGQLALQYARSAFDSIGARQSAPWEIALAHAIVADAAAASAESTLHALHFAKSRELGDALADPDEKAIFFATFDRIASP